MTKHGIVVYFLIFILVTALAVVFILFNGFHFANPTEFSSFFIFSNQQTVQVYVCGAVENSGYYFCRVGDTHISVVQKAGILPQSYLSSDLYETKITKNTTSILVNYVNDGQRAFAINVNTTLTTLFDGVFTSDQVQNLMTAKVQLGTITNLQQLKPYLGDDYFLMYYKLYVDEVDYETD